MPLRLGSSGARPGWLRPGCALAALVLPAGLWLAFLLGFEAVRCRASLLLPTGISCVFRNSPSPAPAQSPVRLRVRNCDPPKRKRALHNHPAVRAHMLVALYHNAVADTKLKASRLTHSLWDDCQPLPKGRVGGTWALAHSICVCYTHMFMIHGDVSNVGPQHFKKASL